MTGGEVQRWADAQQYHSEPMPAEARKGITVTLLNATPDPLGSLAALCATYRGRVVRDLAEVTHAERRQALEDMLATILDGPLAGVQFHFLVEGAGRDFTHQAVRDNFSFIAQESLRFAVKEDWAQEIPLPPSLVGLPDDHPLVRLWRKALNTGEDMYAALVHGGMPAEDARKLLPHAVTTRYHWTPTLRTLLNEAGKRTCTQAQFEWRLMMARVAKALRAHGKKVDDQHFRFGAPGTQSDGWQFNMIADKLRPVCYKTGRCEFQAGFDRACSIRERVQKNTKVGRPSTEWDKPYAPCHGGQVMFRQGGANLIPVSAVRHDDHYDDVWVEPIRPEEWALDPSAARVQGDGK